MLIHVSFSSVNWINFMPVLPIRESIVQCSKWLSMTVTQYLLTEKKTRKLKDENMSKNLFSDETCFPLRAKIKNCKLFMGCWCHQIKLIGEEGDRQSGLIPSNGSCIST